MGRFTQDFRFALRTFLRGRSVTVLSVLAFALLVGAGLLVKNLMMLERRETGLHTSHVLAFDVAPSGPRYRDSIQISAFFSELVDRLRPIGGVQSVGLTSHLPMYRFGWNGEMSIQGGNPWGPGEAPLVEYRWIAGDYFRTMGIPLVQGRLFSSQGS